MSVQSKSQMDTQYGEDAAKSILQNANPKICLPGVTDEDARMFGDLAGMTTVISISQSGTRRTMDVLRGAGSRSRHMTQRALIPPNDLRTMRGEVFAVLPAEHPIRAQQRPYYRDPRLRRLVPDPEERDVLAGLRRQYQLPDPGLGVELPDREAVQDGIDTQQDEGAYMQSGDVPPRGVPSSISDGGHPAPDRDTIVATTDVFAVPAADDVVIPPQPDGAHLLQGIHVRVLELMAEGSTNAQIGVALDLKERSVKNYVNTIYGRLGIQTRGD